MKLLVSSKDFAAAAEGLALRFGFSRADFPVSGLYLELGADGLSLCADGKPPLSTRVEFVGGKLGHRQRFGGDRNGLLGRAIGADRRRGLHVVDATAGLAADGFILASLGCRVDLVERSAALVALIEDGLARARPDADHALRAILYRISLHHADAVTWLAGAETPADVIYLDPMYPERKQKAGVRKEMQLLQQLHAGVEDDEPALLAAALAAARHRVVVKRPRLAPALAGEAPGYSLTGRAARFDVYSLRAL